VADLLLIGRSFKILFIYMSPFIACFMRIKIQPPSFFRRQLKSYNPFGIVSKSSIIWIGMLSE